MLVKFLNLLKIKPKIDNKPDHHFINNNINIIKVDQFGVFFYTFSR
jgi:hypothetical protein